VLLDGRQMAPLSVFSLITGERGLLLGYAAHSLEQIRAVAGRLAAALQDVRRS